MKSLTKRQRELIDFIQNFISTNRYSPSYREIGSHFGFNSLGSVHKHIATLKKKGVLASEGKTSRSITTVHEQTSSLKPEISIPLIGHIAAGIPIQTFPQTQQILVPAALVFSPDKTYALRVKGDSLTEEMMADGDILLIEVRQKAHPGETVVALINENDIIIKKYYPEGCFIRLLGTNSHHHPIILRQEDIVLQAVVIGLLRQYG